MKKNRVRISKLSKTLMALAVISMLTTGVTAYAGVNNEDAYWFDFSYDSYGEEINVYSQWAQKDTTGPVRAVCQSATSSFSVCLVGCVNDYDSPSVSAQVSSWYYMGNGTSCNIANTALSQQPNRAWVALKCLYQGDSEFRASGLYVPN